MIKRLVGFLDRSEWSLNLALRSSRDASPVRTTRHVGLHGDPQLRHHPTERAGLRDRAIVQIEHRRDALENQAWLIFRSHRVEQETQRRSDVLAINATIFLIGDATAVIDDAE